MFDDGEDMSLTVDYEPNDGPELEEGELATRHGTNEDWVEYIEYCRPSTRISCTNAGELGGIGLESGDEGENSRIAAKKQIMVANHEICLEPIGGHQPKLEITYKIPMMQSPDRWQAHYTQESLLVKVRVHFEDFDATFHGWRDEKMHDGNEGTASTPNFGPPLETKEGNDANFLSSVTTEKNSVTRGVSTSAQGERG